MKSNRLEAFSDAVIAILMTIMVLELKIPHGDSLDTLRPLWPIFLSYVLSFIYLAIYWNNHHHMLQATDQVNGKVLWANIHLLFWLSMVPFSTGWMGENRFAELPLAIYGLVLLGCAVSYTILQRTIINHGRAHDNKLLADAVKGDVKGWISVAAYVVAIPLAFYNQWVSGALYIAVAMMWLAPDPRIEKKLDEAGEIEEEQEDEKHSRR